MKYSVALVSALGVFAALPAFADITIKDSYVRSASPKAKTGAAFMIIENSGEADHLIDVASDVAVKVELHTHIDNGEGVMRMVHVEEGFDIPAGGQYVLKRGGDHVMFMGLKQSLVQGETVDVTLIFEKAGEVVVAIPVDHARKADHGAMSHGDMHKKKASN